MKPVIIVAVLMTIAVTIWSSRPPTTVSGIAPVFLVPREDSSAARLMVQEIFADQGAPIDTVELTASGQLHLTLQPGTYRERPRIVGSRCDGGTIPSGAMENVIAAAYRLYGKSRNVQAVYLVVPADSAIWGSWFSRQECRSGPATMIYPKWRLESLSMSTESAG